MRVEGNAEPSTGTHHRRNDGLLANAAARGDKERIARPEWFPRGQIGVERCDRHDMEWHDAILASLAPYAQATGHARIIAHTGSHHLATTETGECARAICRASWTRDGGFGLVPLHDARQMALALRHGELARGIALDIAAIHQPGAEAASSTSRRRSVLVRHPWLAMWC